MANENYETLTFRLVPGATFTQTYEEQGTVIHQGGTATGVVNLTPKQAIVLKAGSPGSIFQPVGGQGGDASGGVVGQTGQEQGQPQEGTEASAAQAEQDTAVAAYLSRPVKEIVSGLEQVNDAQFISQLHDKETKSTKPRQAVIDALNTRYDAVMADQK